MADTPERLWLDESETEYYAGGIARPNCVEYVRADLAPAPPPAPDRDWPIKEFRALLASKSRYLFYLHQWVPYQDVGMLRLKLFHDAKTFDGRIAMHIWPNGNHCGPFIDSEVEFIRISLDQGWGTQEQSNE